MLNPDLLDDDVLGDILANMDPDDVKQDTCLEDLKTQSVEEGFDRFLNWNGIIGYTGMLLNAVRSLLAAEVPYYEPSDGSLIHDGKQKSFSETVNVVDELELGEVLVVTRLDNGCFYARTLQ